MTITIHVGDCRDVLKTMDAESVHCVVTSPPYFQQRDYGIDGQLGLEDTPGEYVAHLVDIFREVRRVLRDDGQLFLNISDTRTKDRQWHGIPHRLVFALQDDGWRFEDEIIWEKKNCMPGSQTNRFTRSHELVFMLNKSKDAFFDLDAVREAHSREWWTETVGPEYMTAADGRNDGGKRKGDGNPAGRTKRSVWTVNTRGFSGAHFAVFPQALVEPMIKAGSSERGCCPECGAGWRRVIERTGHINKREPAHVPGNSPTKVDSTGWAPTTMATDCWLPSCQCDAGDPIPATILDPFAGAGTTLLVTEKLGRDSIGIELSPEYAAMAVQRIRGECGTMFTDIRVENYIMPLEKAVDDY